MIAGTGRAGTSFLVQFLEACGLDTGATEMPFDARARAGLERNLLDERAPYIVKDPWLFAYCDQIDQSEVEVEALLVPVRELAAAATSRILQERITMADSLWADLPPSDVHGMVTGGVVYSLDPLDEARILAVGFHRLILWATARQIPLFLLEFPRIVNDAEYLIDTLWPWLGAHCERDRAMSAFASVADPDLVRVDGARVLGSEGRMADAEQLDRAAMSLLLKEREAILASTRDDLAATEQRLSETEQRLSETERRLAETRDRLAASEREASETEQQLGSRLAEGEAALAQRSITLAQTERALDAATTEVDAVHRTLSWRLTRPLRALRAKRSGRDLAPEEVSSEPLGPSASDELRVETGDHKAGQPAT
ncbi:MAG: hypothetical protein ABSG39_06470 [Acidimicrobiales bacterium]